MTGPQNDTTRAPMEERRTRIIALGAGLGALIGLISSYLYTRAAEESENTEAGAPVSVSTGQMLGVLLTMLGLVRQIAELGKPKKSDERGKK